MGRGWALPPTVAVVSSCGFSLPGYVAWQAFTLDLLRCKVEWTEERCGDHLASPDSVGVATGLTHRIVSLAQAGFVPSQRRVITRVSRENHSGTQ